MYVLNRIYIKLIYMEVLLKSACDSGRAISLLRKGLINVAIRLFIQVSVHQRNVLGVVHLPRHQPLDALVNVSLRDLWAHALRDALLDDRDSDCFRHFADA